MPVRFLLSSSLLWLFFFLFLIIPDIFLTSSSLLYLLVFNSAPFTTNKPSFLYSPMSFSILYYRYMLICMFPIHQNFLLEHQNFFTVFFYSDLFPIFYFWYYFWNILLVGFYWQVSDLLKKFSLSILKEFFSFFFFFCNLFILLSPFYFAAIYFFVNSFCRLCCCLL